MNLKGSKIIFAAQYAAPYKGNFIPSLEYLARNLKKNYNAIIAFIFPYTILETKWGFELTQNNIVYLTGNNKKLVLKKELELIVKEFEPDLVYSHFEGYDIPLLNAVRYVSPNAKVIWHMHDTLTFEKNIFKKLYQCVSYFRHYGLPFFKNKNTQKPVLIAVCKHELDFICPFRFNTKIKFNIIPNGIDITRIQTNNNISKKQENEPFTFLAFGGRNYQKRIDLILKSASLLNLTNDNFKIILTLGVDTLKVINEIFPEEKPSWLILTDQVDNINTLFKQADCFISSSVHETFSYAIAEATIFGLPVIQSDIDGTSWNKNNPSTFTFKSEDIYDLHNKMRELLKINKSTLIERCRITQRNNIEQYSLEAWSNKIINFFNQL